MRFLLSALFVLCLSFTSYTQVTHAADWAVVVAGSATYDNYRHQSDACHAYQVVAKHGIPDSRIITMYYNDIAYNTNNPWPGTLYNKPADDAGVNVYQHCKQDYTAEDVTPDNFLSILTGNSTNVPAGKPVLQSTANDRVFVFFADHGATGLIAFPTAYLYAEDLLNALQYMYTHKMYSKLVFYMEACESGSMFDNLPTHLNIYATTAANDQESSWATYCPPEDMVNGQEINSCLGDLYSVNWMEDADQVLAHAKTQTLQQQFNIVQNLTDQSHVSKFGDFSFVNLPILDFEGQPKTEQKQPKHAAHTHADVHQPRHPKKDVSSSVQSFKDLHHCHSDYSPEYTVPQGKALSSRVDSRDVSLHLAYYRYIRAKPNTLQAKLALYSLQREIKMRKMMDAFFTKFAQELETQANALFVADDLLQPPTLPILNWSCVKQSVKYLQSTSFSYTDYSLKFHKVIVNACHKLAGAQEQITQQVIDTLSNIVMQMH